MPNTNRQQLDKLHVLLKKTALAATWTKDGKTQNLKQAMDTLRLDPAELKALLDELLQET